jgi:hypothetical protein
MLIIDYLLKPAIRKKSYTVINLRRLGKLIIIVHYSVLSVYLIRILINRIKFLKLLIEM